MPMPSINPLLSRPAFLLAALLSVISDAHATPANIIYNGHSWTVDYLEASYDTNSALFTSGNMPWYGDANLAAGFAQAAHNAGIAGVNLLRMSSPLYEPIFAYAQNSDPGSPPIIPPSTYTVSKYYDYGFNSVQSLNYATSNLLYYATAVDNGSVPEPSTVTLSLLGLGLIWRFTSRREARIK